MLQLAIAHFILFFKNSEKKIDIYIYISCNENKIEAHTCIQKMGNVFLKKCQHN
jgi:hypothetical protein